MRERALSKLNDQSDVKVCFYNHSENLVISIVDDLNSPLLIKKLSEFEESVKL